jgi:ABC-type Mn2+/Zn2+ transport system permease subunit/ubiquinone/menaquinone biosynthesis C-methylase UbiE
MKGKKIISAIVLSVVGIAFVLIYSFFNEEYAFFVVLPERILIKIIISAVLAGLALSLVGTFVVHMNITSVGFAMSHAAFAGAALGLLLESYGSQFNPVYMATIFTILVAFLLGPLSEKTKLDSNIILGILFSLMIALGFIFISLMPEGVTSASSMGIIWGSLFGLSEQELIILIILNISVILFIIIFFKELMGIMLNQKMAKAAGIPVAFFKFLILLATAIAVSFSINIVGAFLVYAMIVNPTSTVYQYVYDTKKLFIFSPIVGVGTILGGVYLSLWMDFPIASSIIIFSSAIFALSVLISPKHRKVEKQNTREDSNGGSIEKIKHYFNSKAENWDDEVNHDPDKLKEIIRVFDLEEGSKVLDVGTGTGVMIPYLLQEVKKNGKIVAIDVSEKMVAIAKERYDENHNIEFIVGDVNKLQLENEFDAILCYSCFPHFLDQDYTLEKLYEQLKEGGKLMIVHSQSRDFINNLHRNIKGIVSDDRLPPMEELRKMVKETKLEVLGTRNDE